MIFSINEIKEWYSKFDTLKYPTKLYDELVYENKNHPNKIELLGAWKTGSIRINNRTSNPIYIDKNNVKYEFTNRWKESTPVGYTTWKYLSDNISMLYETIPSEIQLDEPKILVEMKARKGFGFIWGLFILHSIYPRIYPLYDQHVYRAYKRIANSDIALPSVASKSWSEYCKYRTFFNQLVSKEKCSPIKIDRALWAYGKYLKVVDKKNITKNSVRTSIQFNENNDCYCLGYTLGGKHKIFWWRLKENYSLEIIRKFNADTGKINSSIFTEKEIDKIQEFINGNKIPLANNVQKLQNGTEKEGLGKFLYENLDKNTTEAQLASHISAIFYYSGIWDYNEKKKGMLFWRKTMSWKSLLNSYFLNN